MVKIEQSLKSNLEEVKKILFENDLSINDIEESVIQFFVTKEKNNIVGVIGLKQYKTIVFLRSLAVRNRYKNQKNGRYLIEYLLKYCRNKISLNYIC